MGDTELLVQRAAQARFSRRHLLRGGAVAAGVLVGSGAYSVASAFGAPGDEPRPIPGGFASDFSPVPKDPFIHVLPPGAGFEMSTITDFNGAVAACDVQGTANNGAFFFDADMRFMEGLYAGTDGKLRQGRFGFV